MTDRKLLEYRVVSQQEMDVWPVDKARSGEKQWAETTWGGDRGESRKLFNWNIWPCRVVFEVGDARANSTCVARGEAVWRRSLRSIRLRGLKLLSAASNEEIRDARLVHYDRERVIVEFRPVSGPGLYYLYYAAHEAPLFHPSEEWLEAAEACEQPILATPLRIESRCELDSFYPMETIALDSEVQDLLDRFPGAAYLVFPEDRDRPIKLDLEIPAHWAREGPRPEISLAADRNEYRVFQIGLWACRAALDDVKLEFSDLRSADGRLLVAAEKLQCLTTESRIKSLYIRKPTRPYPVPKGEVRALWCGIDIPADATPGEYIGTVAILPSNQSPTVITIRLTLSDTVVEERGDHDLRRLSRLRWIESDIGLSDKVYPPYRPLRLSKDKRSISTWGHTLRLSRCGLPEGLRFGNEEIMAAPLKLDARSGARPLVFCQPALEITEATPGHISWEGTARRGKLRLLVRGRIEYDGCVVLTLGLDYPRTAKPQLREARQLVSDLALRLSWRKEHAFLASGMGYRGRREGDRVWRRIARGARCFEPSLWLGSVEAGLAWVTWDSDPWEDISRVDAATVREEEDAVVLQLNLGDQRIRPGHPWQMQFALLPTPVKPRDQRHWQFRYLHRGGDFEPHDDTPQAFLAENCKRLEEVKALGVKRLNLHDWWGPAFNYPWQWDGPDNLSRLTAEAHKRGIYVKVYNSGRELSTLAPEFWALVYEGTQHRFRGSVEPNPRLRFQDAWHENHLPDGLPQGWPRLHKDRGNEHSVPVSNATRIGNFYLESIRYMTQHFGTDGAYWDGADGPTLGHREMAKRLWTIFREVKPEATIDVHHGNDLVTSPITSHILVFPFIDSIWHGEGFEYDRFDPWTWLVEISGLPFNIPSEVLGGEEWFARGMLFGIWSRAGWGAGTEKQRRLWAFFDRFRIEEARMLGWWERNGVTVDRPETYVTAFCHRRNGVLLAIASWHPPLAGWMEENLDVSIALDRRILRLPKGRLSATDILTDETLDIEHPVPLPDPKQGRLIWLRR